MTFELIWLFVFALIGWLAFLLAMIQWHYTLNEWRQTIDSWGETIDLAKTSIQDRIELINKIKAWGNTTSESESVSQKEEEATSTAQEEAVL